MFLPICETGQNWVCPFWTLNSYLWKCRERSYEVKKNVLLLFSFKLKGVIRVPAPCHYAHKLAYLVGQSIHQVPHQSLSNRLFYLWPTEESLMGHGEPQLCSYLVFLLELSVWVVFLIILGWTWTWFKVIHAAFNTVTALTWDFSFPGRRTHSQEFVLHVTFPMC